MDAKEILEKAIKKAVAGGWDNWYANGYEPIYFGGELIGVRDLDPHAVLKCEGIEGLLFNHDFARALWGDEHDCDAGFHEKKTIFHNPATNKDEVLDESYTVYCLHQKDWKHHLQNMVIADNPIEYLGSNL